MVESGRFTKIEKKNSHWRLTLANPERGNSYNNQSIQEIKSFFLSLQKETNIKFAVLAAEGKNFCTGADLKWMAAARQLDPLLNLKEMEELALMYDAIDKLKIPVVAKVRGKVLGGGVGLVACCDFVLASDNCEFALPEIKKGLIPGIVTPLIIRKCGEENFKSWSESARRFGTEEALQSRLVQEAAGEPALDAEFENKIEQFKNLKDSEAEVLMSQRKKIPVELEVLKKFAKESAEARRNFKEP
ncbi:MAG: enoyl-CoA hydratase-related protein [Pseudobdellovibrio sp.]